MLFVRSNSKKPLSFFFFFWYPNHEERVRERYGETLTQPAKVRMQTQTGSKLPGLLICTRPHSNNSQNTHTHNTLIFQQK